MKAPDEIKNMFLSADGDDLLNTETSLVDEPIVSVGADGKPVRGKPFCTQKTDSLKYGERPPVMKSFVYGGEENGVHTFTTYRPRVALSADGEPNYWFGYQTFTCDCNGDTTGNCKKLVDGVAERAKQSYPRVTCPQVVSSPVSSEPEIGRQTQKSALSETDPSILFLRSPGNGQSLLMPQHFERIKAGNCRGGAASPYEECGPYAYLGRNPAKNYLMTFPQDPGVNLCQNRPARCSDDRFFLQGISPQ
jgi:hypothetical protein